MKKAIIRIISLISSILIVMEIFNRVVLYLTKKDNKINLVVDKTYNWRLGNVKYMTKGNGEPILFIHDMTPGSSSLEWKKTIDSFAKKYCVYVIDLPGFGSSDKNIKTYTNYLYISLIKDFIKDVIKNKTTIITSGEAASIAILSAYQNDNLFNKIILVNPGSIEKYNRVPTDDSKNLKTIFSLPIIGTFLYIITNLVHSNSMTSLNYDSENEKYYYASYIGNYVNFPIKHRINNLNVPLSLVMGTKATDTFDILSEYEEYIDSYDTIKNASQFPHIEEPEAFYKACDILLQCDYNDI